GRAVGIRNRGLPQVGHVAPVGDLVQEVVPHAAIGGIIIRLVLFQQGGRRDGMAAGAGVDADGVETAALGRVGGLFRRGAGEGGRRADVIARAGRAVDGGGGGGGVGEPV